MIPIDGEMPACGRPSYGDTRSKQAWHDKCEAAFAKQTVKYEVRPECTVFSETRGQLAGGAEVTIADFHGHHNKLQYLVELKDVVARLPDDELIRRQCPADARYVVGPSSAIIAKQRGVLGPGWPCQPSDFDIPGEPAREQREARVRLDGTVEAGIPGYPGTPAVPGQKVLDDYIARGLVLDRHAPKAKKSA